MGKFDRTETNFVTKFKPFILKRKLMALKY